ncbi:MAG TPA: sugar ABC transporter substrate-binding protein [Firmicutes bacterium]|nr:sugar ABC transporter substrate-binding protein [Bacillota bacterium]
MNSAVLRKSLMITVLAVLLLGNALAQAQVTITYMHRSIPLETEWAQRVAAAFEEAHPDIKVELLSGGSHTGYLDKLTILVASGMAPDVHFGTADRLLPIYNGWILDLTELVERDLEELAIDDFLPGIFNSYGVNGKLYGMPINVVPQVVFWNKDLFAQQGIPPLTMDWDATDWTWDEFIQVCRRLTERGPDNQYRRLGVGQATETYLPDVTWIFGGDWFPEEAYVTGIAREATMTRPETIQAFEAMAELYQNYAAEGPAKGISSWSGFEQGLLGMDWIGMWKLKNFLTATETGNMAFDWGMAPVPKVKNRANTRWVDGLFIAKDSQNIEAAWEFVKFATGTEGLALWAEITGDIPARRSALPVYVDKITDIVDIPQNALFAFIDGTVANSRRAIEESIMGTGQILASQAYGWFGPILDGTEPASTRLELVQHELNIALANLFEE